MRDVAVVGFAQRQMKEMDGSPTCVEILVPIFAELFEQTGWTKSDIGFWCSGSSDYLAGLGFVFVSIAVYQRISTLETQITKLTRELALHEAESHRREQQRA